MKWIYFVAYLATIPLANWMIGNVGTCIADGPCLVPVGFGFTAPSGVLMIGAALVLRDAVQSAMGLKWTLGAICAGISLSAFVAQPSLVFASAVAFAISEFADLAIYTPLMRKGWVAGSVLASGVVGSTIDSAAFLFIAFGSFNFIEGQILGKLWMTAIGACLIFLFRNAALIVENKEPS
jgi:hypothetical protein